MTDQSLDKKAQIADLTFGVNLFHSFNINEGNIKFKLGESYSAPLSTKNMYLTKQRNKSFVYIIN